MKSAKVNDMSTPAIDPKSLSVDERLRLIDEGSGSASPPTPSAATRVR